MEFDNTDEFTSPLASLTTILVMIIDNLKWKSIIIYDLD
jgi:hypothetical protein